MGTSRKILGAIIILAILTTVGCTSSTIKLSSLPLPVQDALKNEFNDPQLKKVELDKLEELDSFTVQGTGTKVDLSIIKKMKGIHSITLNDLEAENYDFLYSLPELTYLSLGRIDTKVMPDFSKLNLQAVDFFDLNIESLELLKENNELKTLNVKQNQIKSLDSFLDKTELNSLILSYNPITDLSKLKVFTKLKRLEIRSTSVTDLSALSNNKEIEMLDIRDTPINSVADIAQLPNLKILLVTFKNIKDLDLMPSHVQVSEQNILAY